MEEDFHEKVIEAGWISIELEKPPNVTPVLVIGRCCDICVRYTIAEFEDYWYESNSGGEKLKFKPEYWRPLPYPISY